MIILKIEDNTGNILQRYDSMKKASEDVGCSVSSIREACTKAHRGARTKGYRWIALNPDTNRNHYDYKTNANGECLSVNEINYLVSERRQVALRTRQEAYNNRPRTLKLLCVKCNNIGKLNQFTTINSLKVEDDFSIKVKNNTISFVCNKCNTKITIE